MQDYRVELDAYNGPLDLLMYLVKRHEIDLYDIPIAELTDQYMAHLKEIERIDVELAGEFLVMASTLLEIKSRLLLPMPEPTEGETANGLDELDPRYELVQQLLAYKRYKDAAIQLDQRKDEWATRHARQPGSAATRRRDKQPVNDTDEPTDDADAVEFDLEDANVLDLCQAFVQILDSIGQGPSTHQVTYDDTPMALHAEDILDRLQRLAAESADASSASIALAEMFLGRGSRSEMVGLVLATLDLVYRKKLKVLQDRLKGEIRLALLPQDEQERQEREEPPNWRNPKTGQIDYDWPSDEARERAERRARRRDEHSAAKAAAESDEQSGEQDDDGEADENADDDPWAEEQ